MSEDAATAGPLFDVASPAPVKPPLLPGDPVPWFRAPSDITADFRFSTLGGRYIVLSFLGSFSKPPGAVVHAGFLAGAARFGAFTTALVLVSADPADRAAKLPAAIEGTRYLFDEQHGIADLFGSPHLRTRPTTYLIDERLRVLAIVSPADSARHAEQVYALFDRLPGLPVDRPAQPQAPVLIVPRVFELAFCKVLVDGYEAHGGTESGFMVERDGLTVAKLDYDHKRRSDWTITDTQLIQACHARIERRLIPEIARVFQFTVTRIERNLVACYLDEHRGHFNRHRDNTTKGTAHRRFAVSINLNTDEYEGGDLVFPEFGRAHFRPPTGGACVFSCSLLHEAGAVTKGTRYVFVPFLYDEPAAQLRQRNLSFLAGDAS